MVRKQVLQTAAFFLIAYAFAPWISNVVVVHFNQDSSTKNTYAIKEGLSQGDSPTLAAHTLQINSTQLHTNQTSTTQ